VEENEGRKMASSSNLMNGIVASGGKCVPCQREVPQPHDDELLVKTRACGINRLDVIQRMGKAMPPPGASDILGLEVAGEVVAIGPSSSSSSCPFAIGDRVMCLVSGGAYADFVVAPICTSMKIPSNVGWEVAAGIPEAGLTAFQLVHFMAKVAVLNTY
jgi:NADPH:quinone reductase-like Zn-dependent oxidoreductase